MRNAASRLHVVRPAPDVSPVLRPGPREWRKWYPLLLTAWSVAVFAAGWWLRGFA